MAQATPLTNVSIHSGSSIAAANFTTTHSPTTSIDVAAFDIKRTLGTGSFGRVVLAQHRQTGAFFALKKLKKAEVIRLKQVEHTNNERKRLKAARNHPFLVQMFGTAQDQAHLYILLEYVGGGELFSLLRKVKTLPVFVAQFYSAQVVLAFEHLHAQNIIYRDLKPENILIAQDGNIKLVDFGFAKIVSDQTWTLCGTPDYLAPEIIMGRGYGQAVDYYALGVLIYEMLAGFPPFYHENHLKLYDNIVNTEARFPPGFDPVAKDLVERLIEKNPAKRLGALHYGIREIKAHPWFGEVNWERLFECQIRAPYRPKLANEGDCSNFDRYPEETAEEIVEAHRALTAYTPEQLASLFPDF
jgi:serine/threonine protein kinase